MSKRNISLNTERALLECAENIKIARKRRKITATALADKLGINRATIKRLENGDPGVGLGLFFEILNHFDMLNGLLVALSEFNDIVAIEQEVKNIKRTSHKKAKIDPKINLDF